MKAKMALVALFLLCTFGVYAQQAFDVATYHTTGPTRTIFGRGAPSIIYQIRTYGIDSLFIKLEGTIDSTIYGFTNLASTGNDSIAFAASKRDSTFFVRYDGQMPMTRLRICRIVPDSDIATTDTTVTVRGYYENR